MGTTQFRELDNDVQCDKSQAQVMSIAKTAKSVTTGRASYNKSLPCGVSLQHLSISFPYGFGCCFQGAARDARRHRLDRAQLQQVDVGHWRMGSRPICGRYRESRRSSSGLRVYIFVYDPGPVQNIPAITYHD